MLEHLVLCRVKPGLSYPYIQSVMDGFINLRQVIAGIEEAVYGLNINTQLSRLDFSRGFSHGIRLRFQDKLAAVNYYNHPAYQHYYNNVLYPILDTIVVVDFEVFPVFAPQPQFPIPPANYSLPPNPNPYAGPGPGWGNWPLPPTEKKPWE